MSWAVSWTRIEYTETRAWIRPDIFIHYFSIYVNWLNNWEGSYCISNAQISSLTHMIHVWLRLVKKCHIGFRDKVLQPNFYWYKANVDFVYQWNGHCCKNYSGCLLVRFGSIRETFFRLQLRLVFKTLCFESGQVGLEHEFIRLWLGLD